MADATPSSAATGAAAAFIASSCGPIRASLRAGLRRPRPGSSAATASATTTSAGRSSASRRPAARRIAGERSASIRSESAMVAPNSWSSVSIRSKACIARWLAWPRARTVSCTSVRARSIVSRTARRWPRACASHASAGRVGVQQRGEVGHQSGGGAERVRYRAARRAERVDAPQHHGQQHRPQAAGGEGAAEQHRLGPHMRLVQRQHEHHGEQVAHLQGGLAPDAGERADEHAAGRRPAPSPPSPWPRRVPNAAVMQAPIRVNASSAGSRRRIGPPAVAQAGEQRPQRRLQQRAASAATGRPPR